MKEYIKAMVCLFVFGSTFFAWRPGYAVMKTTSTNKEVSEVKTSDETINRKEETTIKKEILDEPFDKCNYKYLKVTKTITYLKDKTNKKLADAIIDSNFRYNPVTRQAVCLSNLRNSSVHDTDYIVDIFSRCANKTLENGSGVASIELVCSSRFGRHLIDSKKYEVNCDFNGNVSFNDLEN